MVLSWDGSFSSHIAAKKTRSALGHNQAKQRTMMPFVSKKFLFEADIKQADVNFS